MSRSCGEPGPGQKCGHHGRHQLHTPHQGHVVRIYLTEAAVQTGEDSGRGIVEHICIWYVSCSELEYVCTYLGVIIMHVIMIMWGVVFEFHYTVNIGF